MTDINLKRQLTQFEWLQLPLEVRQQFIKWFNIPRSGGAIVTGNVLQSDGHTLDDLSRVSLASLQAFLHTEETHWDKLLHLTINKMENPDEPTSSDTTNDTKQDVRPESPSPKRGRPKKETTA